MPKIEAVLLPSGRRAMLVIESVLAPADELKEETRDAIRNACKTLCLERAVELWGETQDLTARDLDALDMAYASNIFTETSNAVVPQWNVMAFGAFTVARGAVMGIYGVKLAYLPNATVLRLPITGIRINIGGSDIVQCQVQKIDQLDNAANTTPLRPYMGFFKMPIIISEDITVTISEYSRTASTAYEPIWAGIMVEKAGRTLRP